MRDGKCRFALTPYLPLPPHTYMDIGELTDAPSTYQNDYMAIRGRSMNVPWKSVDPLAFHKHSMEIRGRFMNVPWTPIRGRVMHAPSTSLDVL